MIKILVIGNSFSTDATCYLHQAAKNVGVDTKIVNLFIGGCSLEYHWKMVESGAKEYLYELNGDGSAERYVSVHEAIAEEDWDIVITQQASQDSGWQDSYEPFLGLMLGFIKKNAPKAKIYMQKTWAYDCGCAHGGFMRYNRDQKEMYKRLSLAYKAASEKYGVPLIPTGDVVQRLRNTPPFTPEVGENSFCRDGFHLGYVYGRYAAACTWIKTLFGIAAKENTYYPKSAHSNEAAAESVLALIRKTVDDVCDGK